ncbi:hypothetical protein GKZ68_02795 [Hymenobacter sp. BRD128]|uniref:DUF6932 family protein n=1 Tax=Hymenobacter sp. BRD128 TaxID=2675878 RepID=UPI001563D3CB|nr:hypothetical protein [Hymenobacter sp. BRD128]QKG55657.1 hypothetical protein GKZ68_02795 [Hymenobacter sp. BRD128]
MITQEQISLVLKDLPAEFSIDELMNKLTQVENNSRTTLSQGFSLNYDTSGNLLPYGITNLTADEFIEEFYINPLNQNRLSTTRQRLSQRFISFLEFIPLFLSHESHPLRFRLWMGGSFVSTKEHPSDIDVVLFLDAEVYHANEHNSHRLPFLYENCKMMFGIDLHIIALRSKEDPLFYQSETETQHWRSCFSKDNSSEKRPRGLIQIDCDCLFV